MLQVDVILHGARHNDVDLSAPGLFTGEELNAELVCVILDLVAAGVSHFDHVVDLRRSGDAFLVVDVSVRS